MRIVPPPILSIDKTGIQISATTVSAQNAVPTDNSNNLPVALYIMCNGAAYVKLGPTGVVATVNDIAINPNTPLILRCSHAYGFIACLAATGTVLVNVSPIEFA